MTTWINGYKLKKENTLTNFYIQMRSFFVPCRKNKYSRLFSLYLGRFSLYYIISAHIPYDCVSEFKLISLLWPENQRIDTQIFMKS